MPTSTPPRPSRRWLLPLLVLFALGSWAGAATSPTNDEWEPVRAALAGNQVDATARIKDLVQRFPLWPDGQRELAKRLLHDGDTAGALASARSALKLDGDQVEAACVVVQALTTLRRFDEVWPAVDGFTGKDASGWLHFLGAIAAWQAEDMPRAENMLADAKKHAENSTPIDYFFLAARIDRKKGDLAGACTELEGATQQHADSAVAWYELGRAELEQAAEFQRQHDSDKSRDLVDQAVAHFEKAQLGMSEDANLLYALGYARYEQAKRLMAEDEDRGHAALRDAVPVLRQAVQKKDDFGLAHFVLGNVLVELGLWQDAVTELSRARALGVIDRPGLFNLALAMERTGDRAGSSAILANNQAQTPPEQIQVAMGAYHDHDFLLAAKLLDAVAPLLNDQPDNQGVVLRFLGHADRQIAAKLDGADADQVNDDAASAYLRAGMLHDHEAQEHYFALQTARGADTGFPAAWQYLRWREFLSPSGWSAWFGNYGLWLTGGRGIGGAFNRHPINTVIWLLLIALPLVMFLLGAFKRPRRAGAEALYADEESDDGTGPQRRPSAKVLSPQAQPRKPSAARPASGGGTGSGPNAINSGSTRTPPSGSAQQKPRNRQKVETEDMGKPGQSEPPRPNQDGRTPGALERKPRR